MINRFNRREILKRAGAGLGAAAGTRALLRVGALAGATGASGLLGVGTAAAIDPGQIPAPFTRALTQPPVITDADIHLDAQIAELPLLPGAPTTMWTFNGSWPGPTIKRPSGETTTLTVTNLLPEQEVGSITVHHHGGHQASVHDGGPLPSQGPILPGASRTYVYELTEDGHGERAATEWYHDHTHFRTGRNNWFGLQGMFLITDEVEAALNLPSGDQDLVLMCANRDVDGETNQLLDRFTGPDRPDASPIDSLPVVGAGGYPPNDEVASLGDLFFVNGVLQPYAEVEARRYRLRLMNASNWQVYNFTLSDGQTTVPLVQVASESGLLPGAVERDEILLGPAQRVEVIADLTGMEGSELYLSSVPGSAAGQGPGGFYNAPKPADFLQLRVGPVDPEHPDTSAVVTHGQELRGLPEWAGELSQDPDRVWVFGIGTDEAGRAAWTINGRAFDHERVDAMPELDATETWLLANATNQSHFIHIHDVDWVVLQRNGDPPPIHEAGLNETFRLDPGEVLLVGSKFTDHTGPYMMHCHMLEHEDHGMMNTWEVVEAGAGDRPAEPSLGAALQADMSDPVAAANARRVIEAARHGRPAPMSLIEQVVGGIGTPRSIPSQAALFCALNDIS